MNTKITYLGSLAASGTATPSILPAVPVVQDAQYIARVSVQYAAMAATTGVSVTFSQSSNDASTYTALAIPTIQTIKPSAVNTIMSMEFTLKSGGGPITNLEANLTNLDATNAALVSIEVIPQSGL